MKGAIAFRSLQFVDVNCSTWTGKRCGACISRRCCCGGFEVLEFSCDLGDHVHVVLRLSPNVSVSQVVRRLKQLTTLDLWSRHETVFKKQYWKRKRILWSAGYYASTVGEVSRDTVLNYVRKQS